MKSIVRRALAALAAATCVVAVAGAPASAAPSPQDQEWMVAAHQGNLAEIAAGQAAQQKAATDTVRQLGQMLITDHEKLDADLTAAAQQLGVTLPDAPSAQQQAELAAVSAQSGEAFDTAWVALQIKAHRQSLALGQKEVAQGSDPTVKALAQAAAPVIQHHLDETLAVADRYGVPSSVPGGTGGQAATDRTALGGVLAAAGAALLLGGGLVLLRRRRA